MDDLQLLLLLLLRIIGFFSFFPSLLLLFPPSRMNRNIGGKFAFQLVGIFTRPTLYPRIPFCTPPSVVYSYRVTQLLSCLHVELTGP